MKSGFSAFQTEDKLLAGQKSAAKAIAGVLVIGKFYVNFHLKFLFSCNQSVGFLIILLTKNKNFRKSQNNQ